MAVAFLSGLQRLELPAFLASVAPPVLAMIAISSTTALYAFVWRHPKQWLAVCPPGAACEVRRRGVACAGRRGEGVAAVWRGGRRAGSSGATAAAAHPSALAGTPRRAERPPPPPPTPTPLTARPQTLARVSLVAKLLQLAACARCLDLSAPRASPLAVAAVAAAGFGQLLNSRVYALLGMDGVYYGAQLGKSVPWVTAWPYSAMANPQYIGCLATLAGAALVMPQEVVAFWAANYIVLIVLESMPAGDNGLKGGKGRKKA